MARFIIRNYGVSRQFPYKGKSICLSNDQAIETDDVDEAAALGSYENIFVKDLGVECATPVIDEKPEKTAEKKERKVTVDNAEAVHEEKHPDEDETQEQKTVDTQTQPPADKNEIAYEDMTVKELQVLFNDRQKSLAKDKQVKTSGLKKADLILCLEAYDKEEK